MKKPGPAGNKEGRKMGCGKGTRIAWVLNKEIYKDPEFDQHLDIAPIILVLSDTFILIEITLHSERYASLDLTWRLQPAVDRFVFWDGCFHFHMFFPR